MTPLQQATVCGCLWKRKYKSKLSILILSWVRMRFFFFFFYSQGHEIIIWVTKISGGLSILSEQFEVRISSVLDDLDIPLLEDRAWARSSLEVPLALLSYDSINQLIFSYNLLLATA